MPPIRFFRSFRFLCASLGVMSVAGGAFPAPRQSPPRAAPPALPSPILSPQDTADPWIIHRDGFYYFLFTAGNRVEIWKSGTFAGLTTNPVKKVVWTKPDTGAQSEDIWAPELHFLRGKWYVYFTASDKTDAGRRQYCLEAQTNDPQGAYIERGKVAAPDADEYAIDGTVFEARGKLFFAWSGRDVSAGGAQNIFLAPMDNPWTIGGRRVKLSTPTYAWEKVGWWVNEGPAVLQRGDKTFIVFSASGYTKPDYCLGMLSHTGGDLLDPAAWRKSPVPVFAAYKDATGAVYAPGHNGFFLSPNAAENWIVYHGKQTDAEGGRGRLARAQAFSFDARTGVPLFGHPLPGGTPITPPAEPGALAAPVPPGSGLLAVYRAPGVTPATRAEPRICFDGRSGVAPATIPAPGTTAVFRGRLVPPRTGNVTLNAWAQGRVLRVFVDGVRVLEQANPDIRTGYEIALPPATGRTYDVRVEYAAPDDAATPPVLQLAWHGANQPFEVIGQACWRLPVRGK